MKKWELIGELTDKTVLGSEGLSDKTPRKTARAILINSEEKIALMYAKKFDLYSLPGGGFEEGETEYEALKREIFEETGCQCDFIDPLGIVFENRAHADDVVISYYFVVKTKTIQAIPQLTNEEIENGTTLSWVSISKVFHLIHDRIHTTNQRKFLQARDVMALNAYISKYK